MIVQCDECRAKFRLDDAKIKEHGVKVRCSKCKHIFVVQKESAAEESDLDSLLSGLGASPPITQPERAPEEETREAEPPVTGFPPPEEKLPETPPFPEEEGFDLSEFTFEEGPSRTQASALPSSEAVNLEEEGFDFGPPDVEEPPQVGGAAPDITPKSPSGFEELEFPKEIEPPPFDEFELKLDVPGETDDEFDFGGAASRGEDAELPGDAPQEFSFQQEASLPEAASPAAQQASPGKAAGIDFGELDFDDLASSHGRDTEASEGAPLEFSFQQETPLPEVASPAERQALPGKAPGFDLGELDFGEDTASRQPEALTGEPRQRDDMGDFELSMPSGEEPFVPPAVDMAAADNELPPLSIASRRKGKSILAVVMVAVVVLVISAITGGGYYFFKEGPAALDKLGLGFMAKWLGIKVKDEGAIIIRNTSGAFMKNAEVGEIFVINGEVVNNFTKPRASIQVKGTLFSPNGAAALQKTAYCGNALTKEQLATLPVVKLESAMNNQFGDSLSNLAVQPGKGIPFVIVFTNVPKDVVEFGAEVVGSTVGSK